MLDWESYNQFDWSGSAQQRIGESQRAEFEYAIIELLGLSESDRQLTWGACSPPGRYAAAVIQVSPAVSHRFQKKASEQNLRVIGVKLFKTSTDAKREGKKSVMFCQQQISRLPGLPNDHIQRMIEAGSFAEAAGQRHYMVQEWVSGETLEECIKRRWPTSPISSAIARSVIEQLFGSIVIPLWSRGTVWWDFRDANFCWDENRGQLKMIDVDSLAAYADEIIDTPDVWTRRDKGRKTALSRLFQMTLRIMLAQGKGTKAATERTLKKAWQPQFENYLMELGKNIFSDELFQLHAFLEQLDLGEDSASS